MHGLELPSFLLDLYESTGPDVNEGKLTRYIYISSPYRAVNTLRLSYTNQSVNVV